MWNLKNKINKQNQYRQTQRVNWGLENWLKEMKRLSTSWRLQNSHRDVKRSKGSIVNYIAITMYGAGWALGLLGGTLCKVYDCLATTLYTYINAK